MKYDFMRSYQLTVILNPDLKEGDRKKIVDTISGYVKDSKALKADEWGQKPLTYPIKRQVAGYFVDYYFETDNLPSDLEKKILTEEAILRHLLLKTTAPRKTEKKEDKKEEKSTRAEEEKPVKKTAAKSSKSSSKTSKSVKTKKASKK